MTINANKIIFRIKRIDNTFALVFRYGDVTIIACKGALAYVKAKFLLCMNNRELMVPVIEKALTYKSIA